MRVGFCFFTLWTLLFFLLGVWTWLIRYVYHVLSPLPDHHTLFSCFSPLLRKSELLDTIGVGPCVSQGRINGSELNRCTHCDGILYSNEWLISPPFTIRKLVCRPWTRLTGRLKNTFSKQSFYMWCLSLVFSTGKDLKQNLFGFIGKLNQLVHYSRLV